MKQPQQGFTLIELVVAVAIVGILIAIAVPSYNTYVQKGNRAAAKTALLDLASRQESYYSLNNAYTTQMASMGYSSNSNIAIPSATQNYYTLSVSAVSSGTPPGYTLQATPVVGSVQATDACQVYQVDNLGNKTNVNASGSAVTTSGCW